MNLGLHFRESDLTLARTLGERLVVLHLDCRGAVAAEDHAAARRDLDLAVDLVEHATVQQLRAALLITSEPLASTGPVPIVPGMLDRDAATAAVVTLDEILGLLGAYAHACAGFGAGLPAAKREAEQAYGPLRDALTTLCLGSTVVELDAARGEGRLS